MSETPNAESQLSPEARARINDAVANFATKQAFARESATRTSAIGNLPEENPAQTHSIRATEHAENARFWQDRARDSSRPMHERNDAVREFNANNTAAQEHAANAVALEHAPTNSAEVHVPQESIDKVAAMRHN